MNSLLTPAAEGRKGKTCVQAYQLADFQWYWYVYHIRFPVALQLGNQAFRHVFAGVERVGEEVVLTTRFNAVLQNPFCVLTGDAVPGLRHLQEFKHLQRNEGWRCSCARNKTCAGQSA